MPLLPRVHASCDMAARGFCVPPLPAPASAPALYTGHEPPPPTPPRPPRPPTGPRPPPPRAWAVAARMCGSSPQHPLTLYTGTAVRQESGWAPHCPNAMCNCTLAPPERSSALAPPPALQRTTARRFRAVPYSPRRRPPMCGHMMCPDAALCCALCPDTALCCAPAHPSTVPLHSLMQRPCPNLRVSPNPNGTPAHSPPTARLTCA